jgi:hypothetical protein
MVSAVDSFLEVLKQNSITIQISSNLEDSELAK